MLQYFLNAFLISCVQHFTKLIILNPYTYVEHSLQIITKCWQNIYFFDLELTIILQDINNGPKTNSALWIPI